MGIFSRELIEKIKSMPEEKSQKVLDGLARLYAVRLHSASEDSRGNGPQATEAEV